MAVLVRIPTPLRRFSGDRVEVPVTPGSLGHVIDALLAECPALHPHLRGSDGALRNFVNVFVNGDDARHLQGLATMVKDGDRVMIVPAIAGGVDLSAEEVRRYSRHLIMPEVTIDGQRRLKQGSVLLIGAGGLGSPAALYLAAAGVGRLGLVDFDVVDESNLQRQILHDTFSVGQKKLASARSRLSALNPFVQIETHEVALDSANAMDILKEYDVVVDGTDNFASRYLTNDACYFLGKPNVYGSIFRFEGQASVFWPGRGPCYRCLYPEPPPPGLVPSCAEGGVLGILPGTIGVIQATEAIKIVLGLGEPLVGRLLLYDALAMTFTELRLKRDPACPLCGDAPTLHELQDYASFCGLSRGEEEAAEAPVDEVTPLELQRLMAQGEAPELVDVRDPHEWAICHIEGARLVPLGELKERLHEFDPARSYVLHCKSGARSSKAIGELRRAGFRKLHNLKGGILAWARDVDPSLPTY
jgi:molybdopterin/thiamine biosynthesis adenylyltransferase/rhodanese-related sulfurtransferase/molybdopterin converting factor small subunit